MDLKDIIKQMEGGEGQTKSAAAQPEVPEAKLNAALEKVAGATAEPPQELDAVDALMKTANELAGTEKEAEIAHSALCGQAFADGAIAKFAAYDAQTKIAHLETVKVASAPLQPVQQSVQQPEVSDEALIKAAAAAGYQDTLEKISEEYEAGHNAALQDVHDQASMEFLKGAAEVEAMVNLVQSQQQ